MALDILEMLLAATGRLGSLREGDTVLLPNKFSMICTVQKDCAITLNIFFILNYLGLYKQGRCAVHVTRNFSIYSSFAMLVTLWVSLSVN